MALSVPLSQCSGVSSIWGLVSLRHMISSVLPNHSKPKLDTFETNVDQDPVNNQQTLQVCP